MKNVVLASLLAVTGTGLMAAPLVAQTAVNLGQTRAAPAQASATTNNPCAPKGPATPSLGTGADVQMQPDEYAAYNKGVTAAAAKDYAGAAAAFDAYLKAYPKSSVKTEALQQEMFAYSAINNVQKTLDTADELLQEQPCNPYALVFASSLRSAAAAQLTDPAAKLAEMEKAAEFAQRGLDAPKPATMSEADFDKMKAQGYPVFLSTIGAAALQKKDFAGAVKAYTKELTTVPVAATTAPGVQLQDTYYLASAYYQLTPPDYLNCAYYAARAANYAPEPYKTNFTKLGQYCYTKFHGKADGYDAVTAVAKDNVVPPATFAASVTPAPKPEDLVKQTIASTPDLATLAISDKEFIIHYGQQADADKVFDTIKGKSVEIPGAIVVSATPDAVMVAVSDDSQEANPPVADFTFKMKDPLTTLPAVGDKIVLDGTYDSYTQKPLMINMINSVIVPPKPVKPVRKAPVHKAPAHRRR
ncbi:MAG: hypothetical protein ABI064_01800 [Acidobacteriaceae bacterium]